MSSQSPKAFTESTIEEHHGFVASAALGYLLIAMLCLVAGCLRLNMSWQNTAAGTEFSHMWNAAEISSTPE